MIRASFLLSEASETGPECRRGDDQKWPQLGKGRLPTACEDGDGNLRRPTLALYCLRQHRLPDTADG